MHRALRWVLGGGRFLMSEVTLQVMLDLASARGARMAQTWRPSFWEGYHESRRCSRDTYPESYIIKYTSIRR